MTYVRKRKKRIKTFLFILLMLAIAGVAYYLGMNSSRAPRGAEPNEIVIENIENESTEETKNVKSLNSEAVAEWNALSVATLHDYVSDEDIYIVPESPIVLNMTIDLTGDDIADAIYEGNGGNSGVSFILIKNSEGDTELAKQKSKDGVIFPVQLMSVGRAKFQETYELLPFDNGFYTASFAADELTGEFTCMANGVQAYSWDSSLQLFDWDAGLTAEFTEEVCG